MAEELSAIVVNREDVQEDVASNARHSPLEPAPSAFSFELLGAVMSLMPDAAVVVDASGRIVSVNAHAEELFGYESGSLVGLTVDALVPERLRTRHRDHRARYLAAPEQRPMGAGLALTGRRRDGSEFPLDISLAPITDAGAGLFVAAVRDVTEQRAATAAQAELATIVRSSLDAIISITLEGHVTNWNPAAEELLGYSRDEVLGEHIAMLVPDHASIILEELLDVAYSTGRRGARDTQWLHRDGQEVDVAVSISPLKDESGMLLGFSSVVRDISERKAAEVELQRLLAEEERLEHQHAATAEIRLALLSEVSLDEVLALICNRASELIDAPVAVICVKDSEGTRIVAGSGLPTEMIRSTLAPGASFAERIIDEGQLLETDRRTAMSAVELPASVPNGPTFGVPIGVGGAIRASLTFVRPAGGGAFGPPDHIFAEVLAAQAALALELERSQLDRREMMLVGDRERIGRDLHDHVIQRLFATGMELQASLALIDKPKVQEKVSGAIDSLDATVREIRNTIFGLTRTGTSEHSLRARVMEVSEQARTALGFEPSLVFEGPVDTGVPELLLPHVLAVVREALSNVARHARASAVHVHLALSGEALAVVVTDNGVGIKKPTRSSGLANLEERAHLFKGTFQVAPHADGGTSLEWRVQCSGV